MPTKLSRRTSASTGIDIRVWAWGRRIDSCVHFGKCLEVSHGRVGFVICPTRPSRPGDPIPIDISQFIPRPAPSPRPRSKKVTTVSAALKKVVRLTPELPLAMQVRKLSRCGGGGPAVATGTCCVTCNHVRACGCAVEMECGSCCSGECC